MADADAIRLTIRGPGGGEREVRLDADLIRIGRARDCDVTLDSGYISRYHARLERSGRSWQLVDEGSKNGVILNGKRVSRSHALFAGDAVRLGDFTLIVHMADEQDADRTIIYPFPADAEAEPETAGASGTEAAEAPAELHAAAMPAAQPAPAAAVAAPEPPRPVHLEPREATIFSTLEAAASAGAAPRALGDAAWAAGTWDGAMLERLLARLDRKLRDQSWPGVEADQAGVYRLVGAAGTR
ncbi:MAG TPA: FHA domain-containing protein [Dehalococcoidia bacterium]|nr:FHA domain-containing protein [Dehalococcoidia bacterium]